MKKLYWYIRECWQLRGLAGVISGIKYIPELYRF